MKGKRNDSLFPLSYIRAVRMHVGWSFKHRENNVAQKEAMPSYYAVLRTT